MTSHTLPDTEHLIVSRDRATGLLAVIAIDDTTLGPALGGIRMRPYASEEAAIAECRRLARAMSLKNALAEVGFGGGKSVIVDTGAIGDRAAALRAFGRVVAETRGRYIPAADMGTGVEDLRVVAETAPDVSCDDADPSVSTAVGVHAAIAQAVRSTDLADTLDGLRVLVQGAGNVGAKLARLLADDGAHIVVCDVDEARAAAVARHVSGTVVAAERALSTPCDVFAPCAAARVLTDETVSQLRTSIVAGAANDLLAHDGLAQALAEREIAYVPDFVANAGGVVQVRALRDGWGADRLEAALAAIGDRVARVMAQAERSGRTTLQVAQDAACALLGGPRHQDPGAVTR